jgi:diguanylate cyclase (GGDEF)-like protein/PAS domain S-box-containing protein
MQEDSKKTTNTLKENIASLIESYAVNDYNEIVKNEMKLSSHLAIIIEDYNMGEILGSETYTSGKIRTKTGKVADFEQLNQKHQKLIKKAFFHKSTDITSSSGKVIGKINVYSSDSELQKQLNELIKSSIIDFILITIILTATLFITLYLFVVKPISDISNSLSKQDSSGLPVDSLNLSGPKEIHALARTINYMLDSIKNYKHKIELQNKEIARERDRFELAVDGTQDGLWDWDIRSSLTSFSNRFYEMLGYTKGEILHTISGFDEIIHPEDLKNARKTREAYLKNPHDKKYDNSFRIRKKSGDYMWVTSRGKALLDEEGNPLRFIGFITDITKQVQHNQELDYTAKHDMLTDLPNRFLFNEQIQHMLDATVQNNTHLALLYIDLDGFKEINDEFGHDMGDKLLIKVSQKIKSLLREEDFVARLGGDEFVVAIANIDNTKKIVPVLNNFLEILKENVVNPKNERQQLSMSASIGATFYPQEDEIGPEALLRQADQAMYDAKKLGKDQYHIFNLDLDLSTKEHLSLIQDFEQSLKNDDFVLYYQPKADMRTNKIIGFETLLRWQHPTKGLVFPDEFLPQINSQKTLMLELGRWVVSTAFEQFAKWKADGYDFELSINISAHEFKETKTFNLLQSLLEKYPNIKAQDIEFEILETHAFDDISQANKMINTFQKLGFKIALDDFGTGYSTLSYLKDLSVNTLKIDRSFVMDMLHDRGSLSILEATLGLADAFGCDVIAEGVESVEHGNILIQLGCYKAQGYVLSKPMPVYELEAWLASYRGHSQWVDNAKKIAHDNSSLYAIVEHRQWIRQLQQYLKNAKDSQPPELDSKKCNFSRWLNSDAQKHFSKETLEKLSELHEEIHTMAKEALSSKDKENTALFTRISNLHKNITDIINSHNKL